MWKAIVNTVKFAYSVSLLEKPMNKHSKEQVALLILG